jgi:hypothetical protein
VEDFDADWRIILKWGGVLLSPLGIKPESK